MAELARARRDPVLSPGAILSYIIDRDGPCPSLEDGIRRLFLFIKRDLSRGVVFGDARASAFTDPVVVIDPANRENNVTSRILIAERDALVSEAQKAYETITWAQGLPGKGETIAAWKELVGDAFTID